MMLWKILKRLQQPSMWVKLAITRERNFSLLIYESKSKRCKSKRTWLEAYRIKLLVFIALQPLSSYSWNRHAHTHNQLYHIPRAATPRGIIIAHKWTCKCLWVLLIPFAFAVLCSFINISGAAVIRKRYVVIRRTSAITGPDVIRD